MSFSLANILHSLGNLYDKLESFSQKNKRLLWALAISFFFGVILFLNILTPMIGDDYGYLHIFGELGYVNSLNDLIHSQANHYDMWGGRSVVHFIAQALLQMPPYLVDVLNSLVYFLFIYLIYKHIVGANKEHSLSLFVLINLAVWFVMPMFGDTVLWITGSANYLWGTTIILLYMLPYRLYDGSKTVGFKSVLIAAPMFVFGIVAGWTNENSVAGMIVILLLFFLYYRSQKWNIPIAYVIGFVSVLIGYALMIAAPGNFKRGAEASDLSLFIILYRVFTYTQNLFLNYSWLIALYLVLISLYKKYGKSSEEHRTTLSLIYILGALAAIYAMVLSPQFPARAWFGLISFILIALGMLIYNLDYSKEKLLRQMRLSLLLPIGIAFFFSFYLASKDAGRAYTMDKERTLLAKEAIARGDEKCYVDRFQSHTDYVHSEDAETNFLLSRHYGIFIEYNKK